MALLQVRSAHGLLATLCEDAELRQAMRDADGVTMLVAALEKPRDPADLDVKGRMAGTQLCRLLLL